MTSPNPLSVLGQTFGSEEEALRTLRQELTRLEAGRQERLKAELLELPPRFGAESMDAFIRLLAALASPALRQRLEAPVTSTKGRGRRLTAEERQAIGTGLRAGERGVDLAARFQVTLGTIQTIKKSLGLVRAQKK